MGEVGRGAGARERTGVSPAELHAPSTHEWGQDHSLEQGLSGGGRSQYRGRRSGTSRRRKRVSSGAFGQW